jgi:hypothetical protein
MSSRTRGDLERLIDDDPYDAERYAVLGDLLQRDGDPRGELIALQLAAERDPACAPAAASYLRRHADAFVGEAFAHLHRLDVSKNYLTPAGVHAVAGLARRVITSDQRREDDLPQAESWRPFGPRA